MPKCLTCPQVTKSIHGHHVVPLGYGGRDDGLKVHICTNCHTLVHQCIEDLELTPPAALARIVEVGRLAKKKFLEGHLEARDRRPSLLIPMGPRDEAALAYVKARFNTRSRSATMLAALHFAATNVGRVK